MLIDTGVPNLVTESALLMLTVNYFMVFTVSVVTFVLFPIPLTFKKMFRPTALL